MFEEPEHRAAERLAAARRSLARGKLRDALDHMNLAIQLAPGNPDAFRERADVFERMGLFPQADADRRRADELAAMLPPPSPPQEESPGTPEDEDVEGPEALEPVEGIGEAARPEPEGEMEAPSPLRSRGRRRREPDAVSDAPPLPPWHPAHRYGSQPGDVPRETNRGPGFGALAFTLAVIALFVVVVGVGVLLAVDSLGGGDGSASRTPLGTGLAGGDGSATPTLEPTPEGSPSTSGSPYSVASVATAWKGKGLTVQTGGASQGFSGFKTTPVDVMLSRGGSTATTSIFVYDSPDAAKEEWDLVVGNRPSARGNRTVPSHVSAWWNANVIVILRSDPGGLGPDALDGLINLGG